MRCGKCEPWLWLLLAASLLALVVGQNVTVVGPGDDAVDDGNFRNCTRTHPRVALRANMIDREMRNIGGQLVITDDCTFLIRNFTYDGTGDDTVLLGAAATAQLAQGVVFREFVAGTVWDGTANVQNQLPENTTWNDINVISVWDRARSVDLGSADLVGGALPRVPDDDDDDFDDANIPDDDDDGVPDDDNIPDDDIIDDDDADDDMRPIG